MLGLVRRLRNGLEFIKKSLFVVHRALRLTKAKERKRERERERERERREKREREKERKKREREKERKKERKRERANSHATYECFGARFKPPPSKQKLANGRRSNKNGDN